MRKLFKENYHKVFQNISYVFSNQQNIFFGIKKNFPKYFFNILFGFIYLDLSVVNFHNNRNDHFIGIFHTEMNSGSAVVNTFRRHRFIR